MSRITTGWLALEAGANDYVTKPFDAQTLLARIQAALCTSCPDTTRVLHIEAFTIDIAARQITTSEGIPD